MVSLNELSYRIFNIIIPKISDDQSIDISEIQYDIENTRAMLIKRSLSNKFKTDIPEAVIQPINELEIESINASRVGLPSDKVVMKTVLTVPKILEKSSGLPLIKRISASTILSSNFTITTPQQAIYSGNGKFNAKDIFCFYESGYLYFVTGRDLFKGIKYVDLHAVFSRPTDVYSFLNTNYSGTYTNDSDYPISLDMIDDIEQIIIKNKLRIEATQPIDDINDSSDTSKQINNQQ
jgi:hypothetical protein